MKSEICIGCIADDFTGAGDAASFLREGGWNTILLSGVPSEDIRLRDCQAVVVALKTRMVPLSEAVRESLSAALWLKRQGARRLYFKYCSTFDSLKKGNIGPVIDAILEKMGQQATLLCPAAPVNGRTVLNGKLYVHGVPLHESAMKDHPLTPMWDCYIPALMKEQGKYSCLVLDREAMQGRREDIKRRIEEYGWNQEHFYIVPDYETEEDAYRITELFGGMGFLTGGSGLLEGLAKRTQDIEQFRKRPENVKHQRPGKTLLLAGSCSAMTLKQIDRYKKLRLPFYKILPETVLDSSIDRKQVVQMMKTAGNGPVLFYCSDQPAAAAQVAACMGGDIAQKLEQVMAGLSLAAYEQGFKNFIVAGGETSGAVIKALGFNGFRIGDSIAPGVPILAPLKNPDVHLILKSGNFGTEDFFEEAIRRIGNS